MCQQVDTDKFKKDDMALLPPIDKFYSLIQEATFSSVRRSVDLMVWHSTSFQPCQQGGP